MSRMELRNIDHYYGTNHVLRGVSLTVEEGEFVTLLGPRGSGKSTLLRIAAGLEHPQRGIMTMDGRTLIDAEERLYAAPGAREMGVALQSGTLWPHMTVYQNAAFGLTMKKIPKDDLESRAQAALKLMNVGLCQDRFPAELSPSQHQRAILARALAACPWQLALDEPLSDLEGTERYDLCSDLLNLHRTLRSTVLCATGDLTAAMTFSTRIVLLRSGEIIQEDTPSDLYWNPVDLDAASFLCPPRLNLLDAEAELWQGELIVKSGIGTYSFPAEQLTEEVFPRDQWFECVLALRPEQIEIAEEADEEDFGIPMTVVSSQYTGSQTLVTLRAGSLELLARHPGPPYYQPNQSVFATLDPDQINIYNRDTTRLIKRAV